MHDAPERHGRRPEVIALLTFALLTAWLNLQHEPWHDELQAWSLALDSSSIADLVAQLRYEGHPPLFYLLLRLVGTVTPAWSAVVLLHWLIACLSAWIVLWHAPFTRLHRVLAVFGYLFMYEYAVIVRAYGLGMCLALGACAAWTGTTRRAWRAAVLLMLLATTSAMGLLLAVPFSVGFLADAAHSSTNLWWADRQRRKRAIVAGAVLALVAVVVVALLIPPPDALFQISLNPFSGARLWKIGSALSVPVRVLLPLAGHYPDGSTQWGSWMFPAAERPGMLFADIVSLAALAVMTMIVARRRPALILWSVACALLIGFFAFIFDGGMRHHGYLVVAFLAALWLAFAPVHRVPAMPGTPQVGKLDRWRHASVTILLALMALPSIQFAVAETRETFSDARQVAQQLSVDSLDAAPIVGLAYPWSQPIAALTGRPVYFPAESRLSTWIARRNVVEGPRELTLADSMIRTLLPTHCRVVVLSSRTKPSQQFDWAGAREIIRGTGTPMAGDPLRVWVVTARRCVPTSANGT